MLPPIWLTVSCGWQAAYITGLALFSRMPVLVFVLLQGLLNMKLFMIYHDAGHGSFFQSGKWNQRLHLCMSWLVWTPQSWARNHHLHHKVTGNRDQARQSPPSLVRFLPVSQYLLELASGVWVLECGVLTSRGA